jgi:ABC-type transport system substrate-binding protein
VRTDLHWSDGSAFTAQDVAFTVNAALQFELGFDWGDFYDHQTLDHAEALSTDSVKFYFKAPPGVQGWQLGALQGPVVQAAYWAPKAAEAAALLPSEESRAKIRALQQQITGLQTQVNGLYAQLPAAQGVQARELQADLRRQQGNLDQATNQLMKDQTGLEEALKAARVALFQEDDTGEPLLGAWEPAGGSKVTNPTNVPNPDYPGPIANFDQATYVLYPSVDSASRAFAAGDINIVLDPSAGTSASSATGMISPSRSVRFLIFNLNAAGLEDAALRRALACIVDQSALVGRIGNAVGLQSLVPPEERAWQDAAMRPPCAGMDRAARQTEAVGILKSNGYSWEREPLNGEGGEGLRRPDGSRLLPFRLMAPNSDEQRAGAAGYIKEVADQVGIPLTVQLIAPDALDYSVLSSGDFDAAIVGWRVGTYPGYLCEWFSAGGTFAYNPSRLPSLCGELQATSDLEDARDHTFAIQEALVDEAPIVPLYSEAVRDGLQGVTYPFGSVLDGLAGVYGAPELAVPTVR